MYKYFIDYWVADEISLITIKGSLNNKKFECLHFCSNTIAFKFFQKTWVKISWVPRKVLFGYEVKPVYRDHLSLKTSHKIVLQCWHLIPALNVWAYVIHDRKPDCLGMDACMTSQWNVALSHTLHGSLMCFAYFSDMLSMGVCTTRHYQTSSRLVQEFNVSTLGEESPVFHTLVHRSVIGIQGLESESVKKNSDSFRFRFLPTYIGGRIIAFRFKSVSDATLF